METVNIGYCDIQDWNDEKTASDAMRMICSILDDAKHRMIDSTTDQAVTAFTVMDSIQQEYPKLFRLYDFHTVQQEDGNWVMIQGDNYCESDWRKRFSSLLENDSQSIFTERELNG